MTYFLKTDANTSEIS